MSSGYWAGDAIATNMERQADAARATSEMKRQQAYYTGVFVTLRHALAALSEANPAHPLNNPAVRAEFDERGRAVCMLVGLEKACDLDLDPYEIHQALQTKFAAQRAALIKTAMADPIKKRRAGWWWSRHDVWTWRGQITPTHQAALTLQAAEVERLNLADLGDSL